MVLRHRTSEPVTNLNGVDTGRWGGRRVANAELLQGRAEATVRGPAG